MTDSSSLNPTPQASGNSGSRNRRNVVVLGATGSVGSATIEVLEHLKRVDHENSWRLWAASAHRQVQRLIELVEDGDPRPERLVISDLYGTVPAELIDRVGSCEIDVGPDALIDIAQHEEVDVVVAAIVGRAGLESTLAAIDAGKRVALANKETLVVAGPVVDEKLRRGDTQLLPVDSEHSAIFQCIGASSAPPKRLILTASGGPFRTWTAKQMDSALPESALAHPTWDMGKKISIDSATMMNKSLEVIEARWLFGFSAESIEVVVHPQSIVHSMVEFEDGSVIAQLSPPDMRLPIQFALTYPRRLPGSSPKLDLSQSWDLSFEAADRDRFPALDLGFDVAKRGGTAGAVVNAANEEAVGLFLDGQIRFTDIVRGCRDVLENHNFEPNPNLGRLLKLDRWARAELRRRFNL